MGWISTDPQTYVVLCQKGHQFKTSLMCTSTVMTPDEAAVAINDYSA